MSHNNKSVLTINPKEEETLLKLLNIFPGLDPIFVVSVMRANFKKDSKTEEAFEKCINQLLEASKNIPVPKPTVDPQPQPATPVVQKVEPIVNLDPTPVLLPITQPLVPAPTSAPSDSVSTPLSEETQNLLKKIEDLETAKNRVEEEKKKAMQWCLLQMDQMRKQIFEKDEIIQKLQETLNQTERPVEKQTSQDDVSELMQEVTSLKLQNKNLEERLKKQEEVTPKPPSFQPFQYPPCQLPPQVFLPPIPLQVISPPDSSPIGGQFADPYRLYSQAFQQTFKDQEQRYQDQFNHTFQQPPVSQPLPYPDYRSLYAQK